MTRGEQRRGRAIWVRILALLAAFSFVAAACGDDDDGGGGEAATTTRADATTTAAPAEDEPQSGGTLVFVHTLDPTNLDPVGLRASSIQGDSTHAFAIYDSLFLESSETTEVVPQIAESIESDDATVWTLTLREGVTFTDGTPYDAEAVKFNTERHQDPANKSQSATLAQSIASMEVVDPLTLRMTLKAANGQFPRVMARRLGYIGSPTAIRQMGAGFGEKPIGAGPFILQEWVRNGQARFTRNPDYWNAPQAYAEELIIRPIPDGEQRLNTLLSGEANIMSSGSNSSYGQRAEDEGFPVFRLPNPVLGSQLQLNMKKPPFDDLRARMALAVGIDRDQFNEIINRGAGTVPSHVIREPSPFYEEDLTLPTYDPEEAQRLINEYAQDTGGPLTFTFLVGDSSGAPYAEFMQSQIGQYDNTNVSIEIFPGVQFPSRLPTGDFQAATFALSGFDPEPDIYDHFHTSGSRNYPGYSNPEVDAALDVARTSLDEDERKEAYATVQEAILRDMPDIWVDTQDLRFATAEDIRDFDTSGTVVLIDRIWLDEG